jgi:hypothetical protein
MEEKTMKKRTISVLHSKSYEITMYEGEIPDEN